jgi:hypothetical protein
MKFTGKFTCPCGLHIASDIAEVFHGTIKEHRTRCKVPIRRVPLESTLPTLPTSRVNGWSMRL